MVSRMIRRLRDWRKRRRDATAAEIAGMSPADREAAQAAARRAAKPNREGEGPPSFF